MPKKVFIHLTKKGLIFLVHKGLLKIKIKISIKAVRKCGSMNKIFAVI